MLIWLIIGIVLCLVGLAILLHDPFARAAIADKIRIMKVYKPNFEYFGPNKEVNIL